MSSRRQQNGIHDPNAPIPEPIAEKTYHDRRNALIYAAGALSIASICLIRAVIDATHNGSVSDVENNGNLEAYADSELAPQDRAFRIAN